MSAFEEDMCMDGQFDPVARDLLDKEPAHADQL